MREATLRADRNDSRFVWGEIWEHLFRVEDCQIRLAPESMHGRFLSRALDDAETIAWYALTLFHGFSEGLHMKFRHLITTIQQHRRFVHDCRRRRHQLHRYYPCQHRLRHHQSDPSLVTTILVRVFRSGVIVVVVVVVVVVFLQEATGEAWECKSKTKIKVKVK